jgi:Zn-dependent peptidase ImmA (M78 family)
MTTKIKPACLDSGTIEEIVEIIREKYKLKTGFSLKNFVEKKLGGSINSGYFDFSTIDFGRINITTKGFEIKINESDNEYRKNFTIAHELGHYFLHSRMGKVPIEAARSIFLDNVESEANFFAASLLMPKNELTKIWNRKKYESESSFYYLANKFQVSPTAIKTRLSFLGLL